jgi:hypothetical protein
VSAFHGSGKSCSMLAGTGPFLASIWPMHPVQLRESLSSQIISAPTFRSCWPRALYEYEKSLRIVYWSCDQYHGCDCPPWMLKPSRLMRGPPCVMPCAAIGWFDQWVSGVLSN